MPTAPESAPRPRPVAADDPAAAAPFLHRARAFAAAGRLAEAFAMIEAALARAPRDPDAVHNGGMLLALMGRQDAAVRWFRRVLDHFPEHEAALDGLCGVLIVAGRRDEAEPYCREAIRCRPGDAAPWLRLMELLMDMGRPGEAAALAETAAGDAGRSPEVWRKARLADLCTPDGDPARVRAHMQAFATAVAVPRPAGPGPLANRPDPERRLRIGYVSADLYGHPVARNLAPMLVHRDRDRSGLYFYHVKPKRDGFSDALKSLADKWTDAEDLDDDALARCIHADRIDILVILAGTFGFNRAALASRRMAPVQVSFHDVQSSALAEMDYLIADPVLSPRGSPEPFTERVVRLPSFYIHEAPPLETSAGETSGVAADPGPPPVLASGIVTFGNTNHPRKVNDHVVALWARVLAAVPNSRLVLRHFANYAKPDQQKRITAGFAAHGIAPRRLSFRGEADVPADRHLRHYREVDISLDTHPFTGATTTFESLWMGVPVVTFPGRTMVSRWSTSMLKSLGRPHWIGESPDGFVAAAVRLAADPPALATERAGLRAALLASPLCDGRTKARHLDRLFRTLWRRWCRSQRNSDLRQGK